VGNQLFVFAAALAYAKRHSKHLQVVREIWPLTPWMQWPTIAAMPSGVKTFHEPDFAYTEIPVCDGNIALHGYYQSEKYFEDALNEVRKYVRHPDPDSLAAKCDQIRKAYPERTFVGVHCRYGDYVGTPMNFAQLTDEYYTAALATVPPDSVLLLYTDDFERARARTCWTGFAVHEIRENDVDTMGIVASLCTHHIIANSSYSWWTAHLSGCPSQQICMPCPWFGSSLVMPQSHSLYKNGCKVLNSLGQLLTVNENGWVFLKGLDQLGEDLNVITRGSTPSPAEKKIVAYNTLGFCKGRVMNLTPSPWFGPEDGLFVRPDVYAELLAASKTPFSSSRQVYFVIGENISIAGLIPPRIFRWQQQLEHLCNGRAYDQVVKAIKRQTCNLLYGDVWRVHQVEIRSHFPEAKWIRTFTDVGDSGEYVSIDEFVNREPKFPCACGQALVNIHCDFLSELSKDSRSFMQHNATAITNIFVDTYTKTADPANKKDNIAWFVEPFRLQGPPNVNRDAFVQVFRPDKNVPFNGTWIPQSEFMTEHAKIPKAGIILSNKTFMPGHVFRHEIVKATLTRGDVVASGTGVGKRLLCKTAGIAPYMYAIVIENCQENGYWTEKLVDSLLLKSVVFYWGAPNVHNWFLPETVIPFSSMEELMLLLNTMSEEDYQAKLDSVNLNFYRAQAWTAIDDGILLETNFMSFASYEISTCTGKCQNASVLIKVGCL
jgi:hypothetical protein